MEVAAATAVTASRDLAWLAGNGWLVPSGTTRDRAYTYNVEGASRTTSKPVALSA